MSNKIKNPELCAHGHPVSMLGKMPIAMKLYTNDWLEKIRRRAIEREHKKTIIVGKKEVINGTKKRNN